MLKGVIIMKRSLAAFAAVLLFFVITGHNMSAGAQTKKAPGIALEDIKGNFTMLSSLLAANNVVISFWSYDCVPCRKEMPELQKMADSEIFKQKKVKVVFVYVEATTEKTKEGTSERPSKEKALEVIQQLNIKETCLMDIFGMAFENYRKAYNINKATLPLLFLVNKDKNIVYSAIGYNDNNLKNLKKAVKNNL
jgi:thiol-disulfide isomerase/thioredoxin